VPLDTVESEPETSPKPNPGPEFWEREAEWARSRFPQLATFRSSVVFAPLREWVPAEGTAQLFITVVDEKHGYRCAGAIARRVHENYINMLIPGPTRVENAQVVRSFVAAGASPHGVTLDSAPGTQKRDVGGKWEYLDVVSVTYYDYGGLVGPIVGDTAHFGYTGVKLTASCGPIVNVPSENGLHRECNLCNDVTIDIQRHRWERRTPYPHIECMPTCPDPVPSERTMADLDRARRFVAHFDGRALILDDSPPRVALYRTLAACNAGPLFQAAEGDRSVKNRHGTGSP
jgi:hypothetical protein